MVEKKLLIIHQGALGDFIMTFPVIVGLRKIYSQIDTLCQKKLGDLARALNLIQKSYPLESAAFAPLYGDHLDLAGVSIAALLKSYERIVLFSLSPKLQENIERISGSNVLRIPSRPPAEKKIHVSRFLWDHLVAAGLLEKVVPQSDPAAPMRFLPQLQYGKADSTPILIHPGSGSRKKNWPLENFILLETLLRKEGLRTEFILGPAKITFRERLLRKCPPPTPFHHVSDLLQALALMENSGGFIGNDSGLTHLAAIVGLPVTVIFGPSDPVRWKPLGPAVAVVRSGLECSPCHETDERTCDSLDCLIGISPQMVQTAFWGLRK